jgi:hypothetical protein
MSTMEGMNTPDRAIAMALAVERVLKRLPGS